MNTDPRQTVQRVAELFRKGDVASLFEARQLAERMTADEPANALYRAMLADIHRRRGDLPAAREALLRAVELQRPFPEAAANLAAVHAELGERSEAIRWYREAVVHRPDMVVAQNGLGELLQHAGDLAGAEAAFRAATGGAPHFHVARHNLGLVLRDLARYEEAESELRQLVAADPAGRIARVTLATVQRARGDLDGAARSLLEAIQLDPPRSAPEFVTLGAIMAERGDAGRARDAYQRAQLLSEDHLAAKIGAALTLPPIYGSVAEVALERQRFSDGLRGLEEARRPEPAVPASVQVRQLHWANFYLAYQGGDDRDLQTRYGDWFARTIDGIDAGARAPIEARSGGDRIRVGFVSRFLTNSTVGMYFGSWVKDLDPTRFEAFVYLVGTRPDAVTEAIAVGSTFRAFPTRGASAADLVRAIRADRLDILVFPELGMDGITFALAGMRSAPIQVAAWGHPVTTGHQTIDAFLSVAAMEPPGASSHYREPLHLLPGIGTRYTPPEVLPVSGRGVLGLPDEGTLYLCPQSLFKIHPDNDPLLAAIVAATPGSRLVLFAGQHPAITDRFMRRLGQAFAERDLELRERAIVLPIMNRVEYLRFTSACDVVLDTLHWSGGNTSLDAIACALPIVTLPGQFMRGRQSMAMLRALGIDHCIVDSTDRYVARAVELGRSPEDRSAVAAAMRDRSGTIFEDREPARALGTAFEAMARPGDLSRS